MSDKNIGQKFRLKNIDKTKNYFVKEINQIELISKKHKSIFKGFNYIEHLLILVSTVLDAFPFLLLLLSQYSYRNYELKICVITAEIKKYKSIIKEKKKAHAKIVMLSKSKLNNNRSLNLVSLTPFNLQVLGKTQAAKFLIFGFLVKENCHNSKTNDGIDMKLGPVTKLDKRNKTSSKKFDD